MHWPPHLVMFQLCFAGSDIIICLAYVFICLHYMPLHISCLCYYAICIFCSHTCSVFFRCICSFIVFVTIIPSPWRLSFHCVLILVSVLVVSLLVQYVFIIFCVLQSVLGLPGGRAYLLPCWYTCSMLVFVTPVYVTRVPVTLVIWDFLCIYGSLHYSQVSLPYLLYILLIY